MVSNPSESPVLAKTCISPVMSWTVQNASFPWVRLRISRPATTTRSPVVLSGGSSPYDAITAWIGVLALNEYGTGVSDISAFFVVRAFGSYGAVPVCAREVKFGAQSRHVTSRGSMARLRRPKIIAPVPAVPRC